MTDNEKGYLRFSLLRRVEHWLTAGSFIVLAITGIPQKYPDAVISETMIRIMGGIELVRIFHRIAAILLAVVAIWHVGYAFWKWYVRREPATMLPTKQDLINGWETLLYNLGRRDQRPPQGFYTFEEKLEYWALVWGTLVMVVTGFFMWNPITAARFLPGEWIPAAKAAHGGEALLAVLSILLWHMYHVLVRTFNRSMFTGYLTKEQMEHEHPLALHEPPPPKMDAEQLARRRRNFWIVYGTLAAVWAVAVVWFVTAEETAASVIEPAQVLESYVPLTPTPLPPGMSFEQAVARYGETWEGGIGDLFTSRCGECHSPELGENNLDLTSYEGALRGGDSGQAVRPGAPGVSLVVIWPELSDHPGRMSPLEAAAVWHWIEQGAPR